jgi:hypothetical protein
MPYQSIEEIYRESNQTGTTPNYAYSPLSFLTRCKGCNKNRNSNNPATRFQIQKLIQNTVRVPSSIYTMNLGALNVYQPPNPNYRLISLGDVSYIASPQVNWNQMSDRADPHRQVIASKRRATRRRPGKLSPGGVGVDIKHNSYDRYLNRIKGKAPLRREQVPETFLLPEIPFNLAYPVYGGKLFKTAIVNNCNCPIVNQDILVNKNNNNNNNNINNNINNGNKYFDQDKIIYQDSPIQEIINIQYNFTIDDIVLAIKNNETSLNKAKIVAINGDLITITFLNDNTTITISARELQLYIPLRSKKQNCIDPCLKNVFEKSENCSNINNGIPVSCILFNYFDCFNN